MLKTPLPANRVTEDERKLVYDMIEFPKEKDEKLKNADLKLSCQRMGMTTTIYFAQEEIVIDEVSRKVVIPYDKLQAVIFFRHSVMYNISPRFDPLGCWFRLKNGQKYRSELNCAEDFKTIASYMKKHHPEIEADPDLIYRN